VAEFEQTLSPVRFETARTTVRFAEPADISAVLRFYRDNRERLRPFEPERPPIFFEERFWRSQVRQNVVDFAADRALRLFVFSVEEPERVIGNIGFGNFVRAAGQYCTLGYSLDGAHEGRGLMFEALRPSIDFVFSGLHFHRIEANYIPENRRSGDLLRRLGFQIEGYSREYLRIDGRWEDHVRTALLNPDWSAT
jgi:[ribosomal protein S5]-alanine N-acetyltransferase